jgi:hypothetical protein
VTITEAMRAVDNEYSKECLCAQTDPTFDAVMAECIGQEYEELDKELPNYVAQIAGAHGAVGVLLPGWIYQMARMCFRFGMRTQRKLDNPEEPTSLFWRSDQRPV